MANLGQGAPTESPFFVAIGRLQKAIDLQEQAVERLGERIAPFVFSRPSSVDEKQLEKTESSRSQVLDNLNRLISRLEHMTDGLNNTCNQLDI